MQKAHVHVMHLESKSQFLWNKSNVILITLNDRYNRWKTTYRNKKKVIRKWELKRNTRYMCGCSAFPAKHR